MVIVMNMSDYEIERTPLEADYERIASSADWNHAIPRLALQQFVSSEQRTHMPVQLASTNVELFLHRMNGA